MSGAQVSRSVRRLTLQAGPDDAGPRTFDVSQQQLTDGSGRRAGQLVVLREVTERVRHRERLEQVLHDRSRVAAALQASMVPGGCPTCPRPSWRAVPARRRRRRDRWRLPRRLPPRRGQLGLRPGGRQREGRGGRGRQRGRPLHRAALAGTGSGPAATLREVNARLLSQNDTERHCTLVHGHLVPATCGRRRVGLPHPGRPPAAPGPARNGSRGEVGRVGTALALFDEPELDDTSLGWPRRRCSAFHRRPGGGTPRA